MIVLNRTDRALSGASGIFSVFRNMANDHPPLVSGLLGLPRFTPGTLSRYEADAVLDSGQRRLVAWDGKTRLATVYDERGELMGWTERAEKGFRQVVMANGVRPPVAIQ